MLVEDQVVKMLNLEEGGAFTISSAGEEGRGGGAWGLRCHWSGRLDAGQALGPSACVAGTWLGSQP